MRVAITALGVGLVFGLTLCWAGMPSPEVLREALLLENSYLFLMFGSAVATASLGLWAVRGRAPRPAREAIERRHIAGSVLFGIGWGVADACPGPIATQIGMGVGWAGFTLVGTVAGVWLFLRRSERETEPATDRLESRPIPEVVSIRT
jgi:uncharacterized membrane protein YedE/YeeE